MLEAAGCSTRNGQQTLEVLLRTLAILELHKRELRTQDKTYIDNPHRHGSEVSRYSIRRFGLHFPVRGDAPRVQADPSYKGPTIQTNKGRRSWWMIGCMPAR